MITRKISIEKRARIREMSAGEAERTGRRGAIDLRDLCDDAIMLDERLTVAMLAGAVVTQQAHPELSLTEALESFTQALEAAIVDHQRRHNNEQN
jgi:hypothetical protein